MKITRKLVVVFLSLYVSINSMYAQSPVTKQQSDFRVFPNPSIQGESTYASLTGIESESLLLVVYDMLGREIYSKVEVRKNGSYLFSVDNEGTPLSKGVYLIIASSENKYFSQKLIVK